MNCQLQLDGCHGRAVHKHHRQMRSQLGNEGESNLLDVCLNCHTEIHANPKTSYDNGWLVYSWQKPEDVPVIFPTDERVYTSEEFRDSVSEGETCDKCGRRVPHAKKPSSPKTKVSSTRVPIEDAESFEEMIDATAAHLGFSSRPHWRYWTLLYGLVLALQEPFDEVSEAAREWSA